MEFEDILYTKNQGVATITLNRPPMNAFSHRMEQQWAAAIEDAKHDSEVKVVVITGSGRTFCGGANPRVLDAKEGHDDQPAGSGFPIYDISRSFTKALVDLDKPYIGAINGAAVGGGMDMASACDIRIASEKARFSMAYVRMGVTPALGGAYFLPRIVGIARACELIWTGRNLDAREALAIGYVSKVVPPDE
ncbi:MAG: enoyl-CoA hydratase/isomerase family protein, partial [Chloroflexota bacterium]|nr:enoyl-CoA hydratase/isomerase family protein [Chloroflexota bacterium]